MRSRATDAGPVTTTSGYLARGLLYGSQHMSVEHPSRSRLSSPRVRMARESLLNEDARALVQSVREMICEPTRTQIVRALSAGPLSVGDLAAILGRSKSATSQHLRVLRDGGVVSARRRGRAVIYSLTSDPDGRSDGPGAQSRGEHRRGLVTPGARCTASRHPRLTPIPWSVASTCAPWLATWGCAWAHAARTWPVIPYWSQTCCPGARAARWRRAAAAR